MNEPGRIRVVVADEVDPWPDGERAPWEPKPRRARPAHSAHRAYDERLARATERARQVLKPGDRIRRSMCGGLQGTFTFTGWQGDTLCGKTVDDCHAVSVRRVNGLPTDFDDPYPRPDWDAMWQAVREADKLAETTGAEGAGA